MKRSDLTDDEFGAMLVRRYDQLAQAHADGLTDEHPVEGFNRDSAQLRRLARDAAAGNVASSKEIEVPPEAQDMDAPTEGSPAKRANGSVAKDAAAALEELAIRRSGSADVEGALHLARLKRSGSTAGSVRAMGAISGYNRLK